MLDADVAVVGMGPAGLWAAAALARAGGSVALIGKFPGVHLESPRLEVVAASTLQRLETSFGPLEGVEPLDEPRRVAWRHEAAESVPVPGAIIDRSLFDPSLLRAVLELPRVRPIFCSVRQIRAGANVFGPVRAASCIDASGRASLSARARLMLERPFFARAFVAPRPPRLRRGMLIAALPGGYVVRICSARRVVVTIYSPSSRERALAGLGERLDRCGAGFVLDGLPGLGAFRAGPTQHASVQAFGGPGLRIGDAALARDALSSQGVWAALADARYGVAALEAAEASELSLRQVLSAQHHLEQLETLAATSRFAGSAVWSAYRAHVVRLRDALLDGCVRQGVARASATALRVRASASTPATAAEDGRQKEHESIQRPRG